MDIDMKYKVLFGFFIVCLFVGGIFVGMKVTNLGSNSEALQTLNKVEESFIYNEEPKSVQTLSKEYDIELVYEDNYTICGETITKKETIYNTTLEELKSRESEKQEESGKVYKIKEESNEKLVYSRNISENCPNHFKAILEDDVINIYRVVNEDIENFYRKIETTDKLIREDVKGELEKGIYIDSYEDLNLFIEDLES